MKHEDTKGKTAIERRFLYDLDATIGIAEKKGMLLVNPDDDTEEIRFLYTEDEVLKATYNLLSYFCSNVQQERIPDTRAIKFVAEILIREQPKKSFKTKLRQYKIIQAMKAERLKGRPFISSKKCQAGAAEIVSNRFGCTISYATKLNYSNLPTIAKFCSDVGNECKQNITELKEILPYVKSIHSRLLNPNSPGKKLRSRFRLRGYGWWKKPEALHYEIYLDVKHLMGCGLKAASAEKTVAKRLGWHHNRVKQIMRRLKNK